jgi:hypothetical protein
MNTSWHSIPAVARATGMTRQSVYKWVVDNRIRSSRLGKNGSYMIHIDELREFVAKGNYSLDESKLRP